LKRRADGVAARLRLFVHLRTQAAALCSPFAGRFIGTLGFAG